jgi:hypothetical protein
VRSGMSDAKTTFGLDDVETNEANRVSLWNSGHFAAKPKILNF